MVWLHDKKHIMLQQQIWTTYSVPEEFVCGYIFDIAVDKDNNKWIGTLGSGAIRFDGVRVGPDYNESNGFPGNDAAVATDSDGNVWFGTRGGVVRYDGEQWVTFTDGDGPRK